MKSLEEINREINKALRAVNRVANDVSSSSLPDRKAALLEITEALVRISALQRMIFSHDPSLEYHFDSAREKTPAMRKVADLVDQAESLVRNGRKNEAVIVLERAQSLEPPPLVYETLEKRISELRGS